jgi:hypothetical protein
MNIKRLLLIATALLALAGPADADPWIILYAKRPRK